MRISISGLAVTLLVATSGCFAVTDLERFDTEQPVVRKPVTLYRDLRFRLKNMKPHAKNLFAYRVVNEQNVIISAGSLVPFGPSTQGPNNDPLDTLIEVTNAVPRTGGGEMRLDFYADYDSSGAYNGIGAVKTNDHAWVVGSLNTTTEPVNLVTDDTIEVTFAHSTNFDDIDRTGLPTFVGLDARVNLVNTSALYGRLVEVRVIDRTDQHTVGIHRFPILDASHTSAVITGMIDPGVPYDIEVYADRNGDNLYQDTAQADGDGGWRVPVDDTEEGIDITLDLATRMTTPSVRFSYP